MIGTYIFVATIVIIIILFSLTRKRGGAAKYPEIVQSLLYDIKINQGVAKFFLEFKKPPRFENANWLMNKDKIGFLDESIKVMLKESYVLLDQYNKQIKEAKRAKSDSYKTIDLTRYKELLDKCCQELEDCMMLKTGAKEMPPKPPTLMGTLFGER